MRNNCQMEQRFKVEKEDGNKYTFEKVERFVYLGSARSGNEAGYIGKKTNRSVYK